MDDTEAHILELLKSHLKAEAMTYADLARELSLSEPTIKKLFSKGGMDIARLAQICRVLRIPLENVVAGAPRADVRYVMTPEEDAYFFENPLDYGFLAFLIKTESLTKTEKELGLSRSESLAFVRRLEKMGFVELHPGDRVRMARTSMIEPNPDGKFRQSEGMKTRLDFIQGDFRKHPYADARMVWGEYTDASLMELKLEVHRLYERATHLAYRDSRAADKDKTQFGVLMCQRPWSWDFLKRLQEQFKNRKK